MNHICLITPHTSVSGGVKVIFRLAQYLQKYNKRVTIAAHKHTDGKLLWLFKNKPDFPILKIPHISKHTLPKNIDCIINFGDGTPFVPLPNIPHILYLQGFGTMNFAKECANLRYPYDVVITTSKWLADLAEKFGHKKLYILPPGIDPVFRPLPKLKGVPVVGCLYHEAPMKNVELFFIAMNKLVKESAFERVQGLCLSAKTPTKQLENIFFDYSMVINPPQQLLPAIYSSCGAWVSSSLNEGFGFPILEAMACGTPVVAVASFGLDEYLVHRQNCILVKEPTKLNLFAGINAMLTDITLQNEIIKNGLKLASKFTWDTTVKTLIKILDGIK